MTRSDLIGPIVERIEAVFGRPEPRDRSLCLDTLIACILSQHTSDANSGRAYANLVAAFPSWSLAASASEREIEDAIRCGGLARVKARTILGALNAVRNHEGMPDLEHLHALSDDDARNELLRLPGVGPKTAAIVLCFAMGRAVLPVDTHVFRVSWRLGLIERRLGEARAHEALGAIVPSELVYRFHVSLIRLGREVCRAAKPDCGRCPIGDMCRWRKSQRAGSAGDRSMQQ